MICTSLGDIINPDNFPECMFIRRYIGKKFVCYNLKYDSGAFLQHLNRKSLNTLRQEGKVEHQGFTYKIITNKQLIITRGKNSITIYDTAKFFHGSLDKMASVYLGKNKIDIETKKFTKSYIKANFDKIATYCIQDAVLTKELADLLIRSFEKLGIYPRKLYSTAYISWEYFKSNCKWIHVKRFYQGRKDFLDFVMQSYNGGKFEVTQKGYGYYYEYDIVSAYPNEIANLIDISNATLEQSKRYKNDAVYGFLDCYINIPYNVYSPIALKMKSLNYYPVGRFRKVITKNEYDYLIKYGADITIIKGYWLRVDKKEYPYKKAINNLMKFKDHYKSIKDAAMYNNTKTILNSFYGKLIQLIWNGEKFKASSSWNPIYGSVITSNVRVRISELQQLYSSVVAVHTDSIISTKPLPFTKNGKLGDMTYEIEGQGVILGSGIYQVGSKSKIRGFETKKPLLDIIPSNGNKIKCENYRPYSWREIIHQNKDLNNINRFEVFIRDLNINFDHKRLWVDDYKDFSELKERNVYSTSWCEDF